MGTEQSNEGPGPSRLDEAQAELERVQGRLQDEIDVRNRLVRVSTMLNSTLNHAELLRLIMESGRDLLRVEACSILLLDEETGDLVFEVALGEKGRDVEKHRIPAGQGIAGHVAQSGEPEIVNAIRDSPHFFGVVDQQVGFETRNMLALPLRVKDRVIGVVELINTQRPGGFADDDLELAQALSSLAAVAIDNARLYHKLSDALVTARMSYRL